LGQGYKEGKEEKGCCKRTGDVHVSLRPSSTQKEKKNPKGRGEYLTILYSSKSQGNCIDENNGEREEPPYKGSCTAEEENLWVFNVF